MTRVCKTCEESKPIEEFATYMQKGKKIPLHTCKGCHRIKERERQRKYIAKHREAHNLRIRDNKRKKYQEDPEFREKLCQESRQYYEENKGYALKNQRRRYHKEKDVFRPVFVKSDLLECGDVEGDQALEDLLESLRR